MSSVLIVARYALQEAVRRRVILVVLFLTACFLALYGLGCAVTFHQVDSVGTTPQLDDRVLAGSTLLGLSMFTILFLGAVLAVFLTLGAVRGDAERGLLQPLVVRPVGRTSLLLGRFTGAASVCALYVALVYGAAVVITGIAGDWWPDRGFTAGIGLVLAVVVIAAISLLGSIFLSSTANGIAVFMLFGAGLAAGLLGQIGDALAVQTLKDVAKVSSWLLPFEALYQAGLHGLTADTSGITGVIVQLGPFGGAQRAGDWLWLWTLVYLALIARRGAGGVRPPRPLKATSPRSILDRMGALAPDSLLEGLNEPQREAVLHGEGPLLILAGAGSGKTRVLTHRIAHLVGTGQARPSEILAITFTNKAAQEMRERVEQLVGNRARAMWVMTFHSACARMLRADADKLGYTRGFTIYDEQDSLRLVKACVDELDVDPKRFAPRGIRRQISDAKNQLLDAEAYRLKVSTFFEQTAADVYDLYEKRLHAANAMDFDDLLFRCVNLFELFEEVRNRYRRSFRHVLVDEYQDTNRAQYRWLQLLTEEHRNLCVVGRRRPVPDRRDADHDGRRHHEADRGRRGGRRGAVELRQRRPAPRAGAAQPSQHRHRGRRHHHRRRPPPDQHSGARALRRRVRGRASGTGHDHALRRRPRRPPGTPGHDRRSPSASATTTAKPLRW